MLKAAVLLLLICCGFAFANARSLTGQKAWLLNEKIDVLSYDLKLSIENLAQKTIPAEVQIELISLTDAHEIEFHFESAGMNLHQVLIGAKELRFSIETGIGNKHGLSGEVLRIAPLKVKQGQRLKLVIKYDILVQKAKRGFQYQANFSGSPVLNTRSWPYFTRFWLPSNDHPHDKALFKASIAVPEGFEALSNGGDDLMPTYGFNIAIGSYKKKQSTICFNTETVMKSEVPCAVSRFQIPLEFYFPEGLADQDTYFEQIEKAKNAMIYFSGLFAPYAYEKLGFVSAPQPFNMESPNLITLVDPWSATHEVIHQWWGNSVSIPHWGELWISEGFTTYLTGFYDEVTTGKNSACRQTKGILDQDSETDPLSAFTQTPYCKGSAAIDGLRKTIAKVMRKPFDGKQVTTIFTEFLALTFKKYQKKNLSTQEFVNFAREKLPAMIQRSESTIDRASTLEALDEWKATWFSSQID